MDNKYNIIGVRFGRLTVIKEVGSISRQRRFECQCDCGSVKIVYGTDIKQGKTKSCGCLNREKARNYRSLVFGIGINDSSTPIKTKGQTEPSYLAWTRMLSRCYNEKSLQKHPSYMGCTVCDEWLRYSTFRDWYKIHYRDNYELDKDILVKGNKVYSPSTCEYIPRHINNILHDMSSKRGRYKQGVYFDKKANKYDVRISLCGVQTYIGIYKDEGEAFEVYKVAKESYVQRIANDYYSRNLITEPIYNALISYKVD